MIAPRQATYEEAAFRGQKHGSLRQRLPFPTKPGDAFGYRNDGRLGATIKSRPYSFKTYCDFAAPLNIHNRHIRRSRLNSISKVRSNVPHVSARKYTQ